MNMAAIGLIAMLPVAIGPLPAAEKVMLIRMCADSGAESFSIALPPATPELPEPCGAKACHAASDRKSLIQRKDA